MILSTQTQESIRLNALTHWLSSYASLNRTPEQLRKDIVRIWKRLQPLAIDAEGIHRLLSACYYYVLARENKNNIRRGKVAAKEQYWRREALVLASKAKRLAQALDRMHRVEMSLLDTTEPEFLPAVRTDDRHVYFLIWDALYAIGRDGNPLVKFPYLRQSLYLLSSEIEACLKSRTSDRPLSTQHENSQSLRRQALLDGMLPFARNGDGGGVQWSLLCDILRVIHPGVGWTQQELRDDYRYLTTSVKREEISAKKR